LTEVYYLKPDSYEAWFLDFETQKFNIKTLKHKIPIQAKSLQINNGNIYVVGGMSGDNKVLRDCFKIDSLMNV
jgi:hypothetical protein